MNADDIRLLREIQNGLPVAGEPFQVIGDRCGMSGDEVLARIRVLRENGVIRKLRARINQRKLGITANALVAWKVPVPDIGAVGALLASFPEVSHCYERRPVPGRWDYSLYTVHHGRKREAVLDEIQAVAARAGGWEYTVMFSTDEFKQAPAGPASPQGVNGP